MTRGNAPIYSALLHHPCLDKQGQVITTAVTNLDVHDGSRLSATYGIQKYFIITPLHEQLSLVHRVQSHWLEGRGATKTPTRSQAIEHLGAAASLADACLQIEKEQGRPPLIVGTSAQVNESKKVSYSDLRHQFQTKEGPFLLLFGTGWGIAEHALTPEIDVYLPPIYGPTAYNHLSVRAAMAITIDRLLHFEAEA